MQHHPATELERANGFGGPVTLQEPTCHLGRLVGALPRPVESVLVGVLHEHITDQFLQPREPECGCPVDITARLVAPRAVGAGEPLQDAGRVRAARLLLNRAPGLFQPAYRIAEVPLAAGEDVAGEQREPMRFQQPGALAVRQAGDVASWAIRAENGELGDAPEHGHQAAERPAAGLGGDLAQVGDRGLGVGGRDLQVPCSDRSAGAAPRRAASRSACHSMAERCAEVNCRMRVIQAITR